MIPTDHIILDPEEKRRPPQSVSGFVHRQALVGELQLFAIALRRSHRLLQTGEAASLRRSLVRCLRSGCGSLW